MCPSNRDDERPGFRKPGTARQIEADFSKVLVVATSPVNRVVVSRIVERCGLKPLSGSAEAAAKAIHALAPGIVILDGVGDGGDPDGLMGAIETMRRATAGKAPRIILLSSHTGTPATLGSTGMVDAVVAKPIMPERLQPIIEDMVTQARNS